MLLNKFFIKLAAPVPKLEKYRRYLFVAPHPDDIEIAAGATVARLCAEGREVSFLICTDGRFGTDDKNADPDDIAAIRRAEQLKSAETLGVKKVVFLSFSDGGMYREEELRAEIAKAAAEIKPEVIVCPDYRLANECHPDHIKTGRAAAEAFLTVPFYQMMKAFGTEKTAEPEVLAFYFTDKPNYYVKTGKYCDKAKEAFDCFVSQFPLGGEEYQNLRLYMDFKSRLNGFRSLKGRADAFRVVNRLHIHCCTEAE